RIPTKMHFNVGTVWKRFSHTFTVTKNASGTAGKANLEFYGTYGTGRIPYIRKVKVETGNKATDFTPSSEDVESAIAAADAKAVAAQNAYAALTSQLKG